MEKIFKNRKSGELAYYKDGIFKQGNCSVEIGVEPSSEFWKEVLFTTDDGIAMFEGGVYHVPQRIGEKYEGYLSFSVVEDDVYNSKVKRFASKQKALEFIKDFNKEAILITEDNVELFEGDVHYYIWLKEPTLGQEINKIYKNATKSLHGDEKWLKGVVTFSTKESAEKYIKENQKKYSLNEIKEIVKKLDCFGTTLIKYLENNE